MADQVEKVTEQDVVDGAGQRTTTRAVSTASHDETVSKVAQIVWFVVGVLVLLLGVRIVLSLLGANEANAFAGAVYGLSDVFVAPFRGLLQQGEFQQGVSRFEVETLVAALVYLLVGWGVVSAVKLAKKKPEADL